MTTRRVQARGKARNWWEIECAFGDGMGEHFAMHCTFEQKLLAPISTESVASSSSDMQGQGLPAVQRIEMLRLGVAVLPAQITRPGHIL